MGKGENEETERKFLLASDDWRREVAGSKRIRQAYLVISREAELRVRIKGDKGFAAIKGPRKGDTRPEHEVQIPRSDARRLLDATPYSLIEKTRYTIERDGFEWEIDVFSGLNRGLILAEVELKDRRRRLPIPPWAGREVTEEDRYYNANLAKRPYSTWPARLQG